MLAVSPRERGRCRSFGALCRRIALTLVLLAIPLCASADVDWRTKGAVGPVANQGPGCNVSLAFAVAGAVEGAVAVRNGALPRLSPQELIDCTQSCGGAGSSGDCGGGSCAQAGCLFSLVTAQGLCAETSYPYTGTLGSCRSCAPVVAPGFVPGWSRLVGEAGLVGALGSGPVLARLEIGNHGTTIPEYANYQSGVLAPPPTDATVVQWVLVVGSTSSFFIVKNSLGTSWGVSGYLDLARGSNALGVGNFAYAPEAAPTSSGACHDPAGACVEVDARACADAQGTFAGAGSFCPTPCAAVAPVIAPTLSVPVEISLGILLYLSGVWLLLRYRASV